MGVIDLRLRVTAAVGAWPLRSLWFKALSGSATVMDRRLRRTTYSSRNLVPQKTKIPLKSNMKYLSLLEYLFRGNPKMTTTATFV